MAQGRQCSVYVQRNCWRTFKCCSCLITAQLKKKKKKLRERKEKAVTTTQTGKQMGKNRGSTGSHRAGGCLFIGSYFQENIFLLFLFCNLTYGISPIYHKGGLEHLISSIMLHRGTCAWVLDRKWFFQVSVFLERILKERPVTLRSANLPDMAPPLLAFPMSQTHTHPLPETKLLQTGDSWT